MINKMELDWLLQNEPPPIPWIVPGFLAKKSVTLMYGDPGVGKSLIALAMAKAVTEGEDIMNLQCMKSNVMLMDAENGQDEMHRRIRALGFTQGLHPCEVSNFSLEVNFEDFEHQLLFSGMGKDPGVIVLDSLRTLWPEGDENDSGTVTNFLSMLQRTARNFNCAIILIHHPNKGGGFRGSGALSAVPEIVIRVGRRSKDMDETRRFLQWEKCRLGPARSMKWFAIQGSERGAVQIVPSHAPLESEIWPE